MQAQSDEIARCASIEAHHHVWTKERKSHDDGKQTRNTFIVSPCIFVHVVFHQLMHSYILLKYYHRQLL